MKEEKNKRRLKYRVKTMEETLLSLTLKKEQRRKLNHMQWEETLNLIYI